MPLNSPSLHYAFFMLAVASLAFPLSAASANVTDVTLDKSLYTEGDIVVISGTVKYDPDHPSGTIQIFVPGGGGFATIGSFTPSADGSFSAKLQTGGTWNVDGRYVLKIFYASHVYESTINYQLYEESAKPVDPGNSSGDDPDVPLLRGFSLDKSSYSKGDSVTASGSADYHVDYPMVTIRIIHPDGHLVGVSSPRVESDGTFSSTFQTGGKWNESGVYTVKAFYASNTLEQSLRYSIPEPSPPAGSKDKPKPPSESADKTNPPVKYVDEPPSDAGSQDRPAPDGAAKLAAFVDPAKDPQHYVDRYNNEPIYKDWFDENFPQYSSIYQAVGLPEPTVEDLEDSPKPAKDMPEPATEDPKPATDADIDDSLEITCPDGAHLNESGQCVLIVEPTDESSQNNSDDNGCLIATAAYGSEMAPQVQLLREIRDGKILATESGSAFMSGFNQFYYAFSPTVADWERQNPAFKEAVRIAITPLLSTLSILDHVEIDSEFEMMGYGLGILLVNIGMYFVVPATVIWKFGR